MKTQTASAVNDDEPKERRVLLLKDFAPWEQIDAFEKTYLKLVARTTSPPPEGEIARKMLVRHFEKAGCVLSDFLGQEWATSEKYVLGFNAVKDLLASIQRPQWAKDMIAAKKAKERAEREAERERERIRSEERGKTHPPISVDWEKVYAILGIDEKETKPKVKPVIVEPVE